MWNSSTCSRADSNSHTPSGRAVELHTESIKGVTVCSNLFSCGVIGRRSSGRSDVTVMSQWVLLLLCLWAVVGFGHHSLQTPQEVLQGAGRGRRERAPPSGLGQHLNPLVQLIISNLRASAGGPEARLQTPG